MVNNPLRPHFMGGVAFGVPLDSHCKNCMFGGEQPFLHGRFEKECFRLPGRILYKSQATVFYYFTGFQQKNQSSKSQNNTPQIPKNFRPKTCRYPVGSSPTPKPKKTRSGALRWSSPDLRDIVGIEFGGLPQAKPG